MIQPGNKKHSLSVSLLPITKRDAYLLTKKDDDWAKITTARKEIADREFDSARHQKLLKTKKHMAELEKQVLNDRQRKETARQNEHSTQYKVSHRALTQES